MTETEQRLEEAKRVICVGNTSAMELCQLWFSYIHSIDDIIDSMEDGRTKVSPEFILATFAQAIFIYNHPFYIQHRHILQSSALSITNTYADSVKFERSPEPEKRAIADVIRGCGNDFLYMIAYICGGYAHMRQASPTIRHSSWLLQHDPEAQQF